MEQFFKELEDALSGQVSEYEYRESIAYYRAYFQEQISLGKTVDEIIKQLGSPRLIAKSIIDARGMEEERGQSDYFDSRTDSAGENARTPAHKGNNTMMKRIGVFLTIVLVLFLLGAVLRAILPLVLIIVPVLLLIRLFRGE